MFANVIKPNLELQSPILPLLIYPSTNVELPEPSRTYSGRAIRHENEILISHLLENINHTLTIILYDLYPHPNYLPIKIRFKLKQNTSNITKTPCMITITVTGSWIFLELCCQHL